MSAEIVQALHSRAERLLEASSRPAWGGLFVVLRDQGGEVAGAIGSTEANGADLLELLDQAASADPRYPPVQAEELGQLRLELWLLSDEPRRIREAAQVDPTRDALRIRRGLHAGTLLPDVAAERGWDPKTTLAYACRKAGLPAKSWRDPETEVLAFRTTLLSEG